MSFIVKNVNVFEGCIC